jgi:hypothetical protein
MSHLAIKRLIFKIILDDIKIERMEDLQELYLLSDQTQRNL